MNYFVGEGIVLRAIDPVSLLSGFWLVPLILALSTLNDHPICF
jgi:hypothetical protein